MALPAQFVEEMLFDKDRYTEEEYFRLEDNSRARWEFVPDGPCRPQGPCLGSIRAMSGGTPDHSVIASNLITALNVALRGLGNRMCRVFNSDLKIHTADGRNTYPDVSVVCGTLTSYRGRRDIITNPVLVAEVLSPSTEKEDRGNKWISYQTVPTLQHALFITADRVRVEVYTRDGSGWRFEAWEDLDAQVPLSALGMTLALGDIYALVEFEDEAF